MKEAHVKELEEPSNHSFVWQEGKLKRRWGPGYPEESTTPQSPNREGSYESGSSKNGSPHISAEKKR